MPAKRPATEGSEVDRRVGRHRLATTDFRGEQEMKQVMIAVAAAVMLAGCEYKPRETFTIATADGKQIRLTCPVVESARSTFTYLVDGHCVVEPRK